MQAASRPSSGSRWRNDAALSSHTCHRIVRPHPRARAFPGRRHGEPVLAGCRDGGTGARSRRGGGRRRSGVGRAFVPHADDASAPYWNPAALKNVQQMQFMAMYMPLYGDWFGADYTYFGFVYPTLSAGAFGLGYTRVGTTFDSYDEQSRPTGQANYSESQLL